MCVDRKDEFAPVKNANKDGQVVADSPGVAKTLLTDQHRNWLATRFPDIATKVEDKIIEIDLLYSYSGEGIPDSLAGEITDEKEQFHEIMELAKL
jgi:hypothetical protein